MLNRDPVNRPSPMRLLEMLADRFGAFEAIAESANQLARLAEVEELPMDVRVAEAVLEFGQDLRGASADALEWARAEGILP